MYPVPYRPISGPHLKLLARCLRASLIGSALATTGVAATASAASRDESRIRATDPVSPDGGPLVVTTCADDLSAGSLRAMLQNAHPGDTVDLTQLACSKITLQNGALATLVPVTITGPGADRLSIDAANLSRVISAADDLTLTGLTLQYGSTSDYGGCIFAQGKLTVHQSTFKQCHVTDGVARGGAIRVVGDLMLVDSTVTGSSAVSMAHDARGGAIYAYAAAKLYHSVLSDNLSQSSTGLGSGGALFGHGPIGIYQSRIDGNTAKSVSGSAYGGGIRTTAAVPIQLSESIVTNNLSHSESGWSYGGGVSSGRYGSTFPANIRILQSTVSHNTAESNCSSCFVSGGGAHAVDTIRSDYSTISDNQALCHNATSACIAGGGGLAIFGSRDNSYLGMFNSTISTNRAIGGTMSAASGFGGGAAIVSSNDRLIDAVNATIAFNTANKSGGGVAGHSVQTVSHFLDTIVSNNTTDAGASDVAPTPFSSGVFVVTGSNNIVMKSTAGVTLPADTRPTDPLLLPLADNGGATWTHALSAGSVAIDHGIDSNFACDQRGWPYGRQRGAAPDIGAFEAQDLLFASGFDGAMPCQ